MPPKILSVSPYPSDPRRFLLPLPNLSVIIQIVHAECSGSVAVTIGQDKGWSFAVLGAIIMMISVGRWLVTYSRPVTESPLDFSLEFLLDCSSRAKKLSKNRVRKNQAGNPLLKSPFSRWFQPWCFTKFLFQLDFVLRSQPTGCDSPVFLRAETISPLSIIMLPSPQDVLARDILTITQNITPPSPSRPVITTVLPSLLPIRRAYYWHMLLYLVTHWTLGHLCVAFPISLWTLTIDSHAFSSSVGSNNIISTSLKGGGRTGDGRYRPISVSECHGVAENTFNLKKTCKRIKCTCFRVCHRLRNQLDFSTIK